MAVAFDAVGPSATGAVATASTTVSWTHTNVASGVALFVAIALDVSADGGFSVTVKLDPSGANTSFVSLGSIVHSNNQTAGFLALFGLPNVSSGAHTITATAAGGTPSGLRGGSLSYTGADTTSPFSAQQSAVGNTASGTLTFTGSTAGNVVAGALACGSAISAITSGTSRWKTAAGGSAAAGNEAGGDIAGGGSVTLTWSNTLDWWAAAAVEVLAPSATTTPTWVRPLQVSQARR